VGGGGGLGGWGLGRAAGVADDKRTCHPTAAAAALVSVPPPR